MLGTGKGSLLAVAKDFLLVITLGMMSGTRTQRKTLPFR